MSNGVSALVVRLGFALPASIKKIDLDGGRVFVNHLPEIDKSQGEFVLVRPTEGPFGFSITPSAAMRAGYKRADTLASLGRLALEANLATLFIPRSFHAVVEEGLDEQLPRQYDECPYGRYVELADGSTVLIVSAEAIDGGELVEAVRARNNVLVVKLAEFESADPHQAKTWAEFVKLLLDDERPRVKGHLLPRQAQKRISGVWIGPDLDHVNSRGQASAREIVDGAEEGSLATLYFTRVDETPSSPIKAGEAVEVWYTGGANVAVVPYKGRAERTLDPATVVSELSIKLPGRKLEHNPQLRVVRSSGR
jgi:hypothetical protein